MTAKTAPTATTALTYDSLSRVTGKTYSGVTNFNSRLQPVTMYLGSMQGGSDVWKLLNTYGTSGQNNGNVTLQQLSLPAPSPGGNPVTVTSAYTYDGVNRLLVAAENPANQTSPVCPDAASQWCTQFGYDVYGNRSIAGRTNFGVSPNEPAAFNAANQITGTGWTYDTVNLRGTITGDPAGDLFAYDAEDRLLSGNGISYLYDGDGRRVGKAPAGGAANPTWYVYDAMGNLAAEYNAPPAEAGTVYLTGDQLGSTRVVTNTVTPGTPSERHDYYPFGEEILTTTASPRYGIAGYAPAVEMPWLFTSKERDSETGLDYFGARYFSGAQGRFTSPDPKMFPHDLTDPQSWNKYGYTRNNPLRYTDPDGEDWKDIWAGALNAFGSDNLLGAGRASGGNSDFRRGQAIGDAAATITGTAEALFGGGEAIITSPVALTVAGAVIPAAGVGVAAHGTTTAVIAGGHLAAAAFGDTNGTSGGERSGKDFTRKGKAEVVDQNKQTNEGKTVCQGCDQETTPAQQSKAGVSTPGNETRVDHIHPKSKGGDGSPSNGQVLCSTCNLKKSNKVPGEN